MAITRGAKKAHRASLKKRVFNQRRKDAAAKAVKSLKKLVAAGDKKAASALVSSVQKALDKAVKTHALDRNTASRKLSRLSKLVKKLA
ncbi:MAG: hypothetical protein A3J09_02580 [Candidatus Zambryskibacteria bacterium RIFCSPLOWO2_02_FULL_51_21]|uniref:Small ribosomal subunit protein bS20 n=1 Tax=Candidatus Zambryskibacteria bacterium RIFCSPHIGHO2_02_FULL_43_37 TaxID=1802749 RepID=A0A1G2TH01_9BACT|nr:MAG: hypothetical protein A2723_02570 [Candidatus Zambryskibacteria bacterium RIFCSPHIGHO2_01_FULL_52_18]OHA96328.1 MAG: hypothetical protein A3D49_00320 [Candidatus Zambryskibacteria bacterium RIFCSPHIGHO2_02_FULL_43_37]OHB07731.1 MAG: hypothetical protein A2944_00195 [Candidatus Zambryskibacteria bacterium RIFCSPLOWO2_01_FULL_52_12]OHB11413.1 MAG: hypothetical protein A3J09_02580 [Candidatus Zambryskibacteria bacterium RIFCSPLOWO2_02_FULL_51_21]